MKPSEKFAHDFFEATSYGRSDAPESEEIEPAPQFFSYGVDERVCLPEIDEKPGGDIWRAMAGRRSIRSFEDTSITLEQLARLLWAAQGVTAMPGRHLLRTAPSAGATYSCETYVLVRNVEGLEPGSYHLYLPDRELEFIRKGDLSGDITEAGLNQKFLGQAPVVLAWSVICRRILWRYKKRAIRYIFADLGHIGQNVALAASAMGFGCCAVGAFYDDEVAQVIGLDREREYPVYLNAVGLSRQAATEGK